VCAAISIALLGKRAEIEVVSPDDGLLIGAQWLADDRKSFFDPVNDELKIMLDGVDHFVVSAQGDVFRFRVRRSPKSGYSRQPNAWQIVLLRDPVMLPRPAEIA